jgi:membrane protease YdiL (CAAX protease family)
MLIKNFGKRADAQNAQPAYNKTDWSIVMRKISLTLTLVFIFIFLVLNAVGTVLSAKTDFAYSGQVPLLLAFSAFLLFYIEKSKLRATVGLTKISPKDFSANLFYIPLVIAVLSNGVFFFKKPTEFLDVLMVVAFMACIAFLEELLFRGMLFKAIEQRRNTKTAVLIAGVSFGFGHIVNLLNGYTGVNQIIQISIAVFTGLVLCMLFARTKSIVPGIVFHFFFNIASALSREVEPLQEYTMVGIIIAVSSAYLVYLFKERLPRNLTGKKRLAAHRHASPPKKRRAAQRRATKKSA